MLGLLLAATAVALIAYFLRDALGIPFHLWGSIIWVMALLLAFMFGLLYFSRYILPLGGGEGWSQGLILIWRYYWQQGKNYLKSFTNPQPKPKRRLVADKPLSDPDALSETFKILKAGMVHSHQALAIDKGGSFQRAAGPGFVTLTPKESVRTVVDLRPHVRMQAIKANTRDGIPLETNVFVTFRVRQNPLNVTEPGIQYPYDRDAIFLVSYANTIARAEEVRPWTEQVCPRAVDLVTTELSRLTLDDLFRVADPLVVPLTDMELRIMSQLAGQMERLGIEVMNVALSNPELRQEVVDQRFRNWQARWLREIDVRRGKGNAEAMRLLKQVRARVQIEIIQRIVENIEAMRRTETADLADIVMLRMIEVLESAMSDTSVLALVPENIMGVMVMDASRQLRAAAERQPPPEQEPDNGA